MKYISLIIMYLLWLLFTLVFCCTVIPMFIIELHGKKEMWWAFPNKLQQAISRQLF